MRRDDTAERLARLHRRCPDGRGCVTHLCFGEGCFRERYEAELKRMERTGSTEKGDTGA
jgi:hypothetical protein